MRFVAWVCAGLMGCAVAVGQDVVPVAAVPVMKAVAPEQAGRAALTAYLNGLAVRETAQRRAKVAAITTRAQAQTRQRDVRAKILKLLGPLPGGTALNAQVTGSTTLDNGVRVDKVVFESQPKFYVTALLYTPAGAAGDERFPAVVMAPGHSPAGKAGDVGMATAFAQAGFVVLSYDPLGQGERLQYPNPAEPGHTLAKGPTGEHGEAGLQPTLIGQAVAQYFLWDGMRAVDYLLTLPSVDPARIGAFGCSGGGAMTALLAGLDPRVAAAGVACYTTSFDALLASIGPQDSEQSIPGFIAAGLDFPDWVELFAPKPYAIIATTNDMFPFAGVKTSAAEAARFYKVMGSEDGLALITGPGGHGNLRPITPQILRFFTEALRPEARFAKNLPAVTNPFDETANPPRKPGDRSAFPPAPPASLTQVTATGQVGTSFVGAATVWSLTRARWEKLGGQAGAAKKQLRALQDDVRGVTGARMQPSDFASAESLSRNRSDRAAAANVVGAAVPSMGGVSVHVANSGETSFTLATPNGGDLHGTIRAPQGGKMHPAVLVLDAGGLSAANADAEDGSSVVLTFTPRPSPPGTEETKSALLGPFYLTELRAELVGHPLLGLRVEDTRRAIEALALRPDVDSKNITAETTDPHMALVLLHAAVLDARLKHIAIPPVRTYREIVEDPLPVDAPQDILPGVLLHYDVPDLLRVLGSRVTIVPAAGAQRNPVAESASTK